MTRGALLILLFAVLFVAPVAILLLYAFSSSWSYPHLVPQHYDLRSVEFFLTHRKDIFASLLNSTLYSLGTVLLTIFFTLRPAKVFARSEFNGKYLLEGLFLAPALIPPMAFAMGAQYLFIHLGIDDSLTGVILILSLISYPYMLRSLIAGYQVMGDKYEVCARNMGAGRWRIILSVELPLLLPAVIAGGTIVFLVAFSEYFLVFLIGGGNVDSFSGYIFPLLNSSDKSVASLLTMLFLVIPVALFVLIDRTLAAAYRKKGLM